MGPRGSRQGGDEDFFLAGASRREKSWSVRRFFLLCIREESDLWLFFAVIKGEKVVTLQSHENYFSRHENSLCRAAPCGNSRGASENPGAYNEKPDGEQASCFNTKSRSKSSSQSDRGSKCSVPVSVAVFLGACCWGQRMLRCFPRKREVQTKRNDLHHPPSSSTLHHSPSHSPFAFSPPPSPSTLHLHLHPSTL